VRLILQFIFGVTVAAAMPMLVAYAQSTGAYLVTYVEVLPNAPAPAAVLLKKYRDTSFKEDGNLRADVLQELTRPNRFAIVEAWRDKAALDAHGQAASTTEFRDKLNAIQGAPHDERIYKAL
jgi:quinol monooxygenase YgiN